MDELLTFVFYHKNTSAVMTLSAVNFTDAEENLHDLVDDYTEWRCDNEDGEKEE